MILLSYGHQQHVLNQQAHIDAIFASLRLETSTDPVSGIVLIDYKLKFEIIRYCEKTVEFFGKEGVVSMVQLFFSRMQTEDSLICFTIIYPRGFKARCVCCCNYMRCHIPGARSGFTHCSKRSHAFG